METNLVGKWGEKQKGIQEYDEGFEVYARAIQGLIIEKRLRQEEALLRWFAAAYVTNEFCGEEGKKNKTKKRLEKTKE